MGKLANLLVGPELYWACVYGGTRLLARLNLPASELGNAWMERLGVWLLPLLAVPLAFWLIFGMLPEPTSTVWLWLRLALATAIGLNACLIILAGAIDYGDSRNAGVAGVWVFGAIVGTLLFILCSLAMRFGNWPR
ncbi:hypothetical protein [Azoarcus olearius]|uniref:Hypothetical membrane protein n=1 Tax=Azoarcus sp. (strain BH72) TaxID=418699 RepID=A1K9Z5_AZOSB|nr:hypothetical protein [Azoarcus olearius]ANQ86196.1 hypothetical protein dqs_3168 [Azoarcus olearius]CAL95650.1 hypothetical membrane protein [Azoarcus olearius]